ncbi:hypothetical protein ACFQ0T_00925 [Kitasatospora gansuensis]
MPHHTDPTGHPYLAAEYQVWPVTDPGRVSTLTSTEVSTRFEAPVTVPADALSEGQTYAWKVRTVAGAQASDWSAPCFFAVDNTAPSAPPLVTSPNYPENGRADGGEPIRLIFDAHGDTDVTGFVFSWGELPVLGTSIGEYGIPKPTDPYTKGDYFVRADRPGGTATVSLLPQPDRFRLRLTVASLDRSFNQSSRSTFTFLLKSTAPTVAMIPPAADLGQTVPVRLTPDAHTRSLSRILSYSVKITTDEGTRQVEVPAGGNGTAVLPVKLTADTSLLVSSHSANGWVSDERRWTGYQALATEVSSAVYPENECGGGAGVPGRFTFRPHVRGVVSYLYSIDGSQERTLPADPTGQATLVWTPDQSGDHYLEVRAKTRDGRELGGNDYAFCAN